MQDALPVYLDVAGPTAGRILAWLEGALGWQVVEDHAAGDVPPLCALVGPTGASRPDLPTILVLTSDDDALAAAEAALSSRPRGILRWPEQRDELPGLVQRALRTAASTPGGADQLRVGGAGGGVGATTVALGLAGLLAWEGREVLFVGQGHLPLEGPRMLSSDDLAGTGTWRAASPVAGCPGLRALACAGPFEEAPIDPGHATTVVRDLAGPSAPDVLVIRRDRVGLEALSETSASVAVVADEGIVSDRAIAGAAGHRRVVVLPRSARVARAVAHRRVPGGLPGTWLRRLAAVLGRHPQRR